MQIYNKLLYIGIKTMNLLGCYAKRTNIYIRDSIRFNTKQGILKKYTCNCFQDSEIKKIEEFIQKKELDLLKRELCKDETSRCLELNGLMSIWDSYNINLRSNNCKILEIIRDNISKSILSQENVKGINPKNTMFNLDAFALKPNQVTLAGEGGQIVSQESYWEFFFKEFLKDQTKPNRIISIGGGTGYEIEAIVKIFEKNKLKLLNTILVEPNAVAIFLVELGRKIDCYVMTAEHFMTNYFSRQEHQRCIFHLSTILNVVSVEDASMILNEIAKNMKIGDGISILMVDEKQFNAKKVLSRSETISTEGLATYEFADTKRSYKTVIVDSKRFNSFMEKNHLKGGEFLNLSLKIDLYKNGKRQKVPVHFLIYKVVKK